MKLPIKPMSGAKFEVDVDDTETVLDVKNKITWVRPENPIETQTLIYRGQMLKDEQKLVDLKLDGSSFFVLMTRRMAPAAPKKPVDSEEKKVAEEKPAPAPAPVPVPAPAPAPFRVPIPAPAPAPAPAVPSSGGHDDSVNTLAMGESYAKAVEDLCGMGFPKEDVEAAMRAAFNSPERAAQYLIDGIPPQLREVAHPPRAPHPHPHPHPAAPAPAPAPAPTSAAPRPPPSTAPTTTGSGSGSAPVSGGLEDILSHLGGEGDGSSGSILRRHPLMLLLRFVAQQDRGSLVPLLQALSQQNPELVEIVRQNQEEFAALLEEPLTEAEQEIAFQMMASGGGGGGGGRMHYSRHPPPPPLPPPPHMHPHMLHPPSYMQHAPQYFPAPYPSQHPPHPLPPPPHSMDPVRSLPRPDQRSVRDSLPEFSPSACEERIKKWKEDGSPPIDDVALFRMFCIVMDKEEEEVRKKREETQKHVTHWSLQGYEAMPEKFEQSVRHEKAAFEKELAEFSKKYFEEKNALPQLDE
eukprot:TRINITY_DN7208_c0_g1_i2.p1 TRINITY_DN7208_c0_g1~~TRINITY_DN7208_c0_g1_i2.p1  ORF type:complete len:521 (+),score=191.52 TRINITY_DN7208_c0_g1_i2:145-1707(+)